ncbi:hypothetical protein Tco_0842505 [Tanacetum coccineum]|uniref:Uncharacterized protein n=1 Tax=Tanacetum coccineum TaxID=301880 RepID=A0ABQ5B3B1_9ASTR
MWAESLRVYVNMWQATGINHFSMRITPLKSPEEDNPRSSKQKGVRNHAESCKGSCRVLGMQAIYGSAYMPMVYTLLEGDIRRCPQQGDYQSGSGKGNSELVHGQGYTNDESWGLTWHRNINAAVVYKLLLLLRVNAMYKVSTAEKVYTAKR